MAQVITGVDRHKRSATIEVIDQRERVLGQGHFGTDRDGYQATLAARRGSSPVGPTHKDTRRDGLRSGAGKPG